MNALVRHSALDGEIIAPDDTITVIAAMHPLKMEHSILTMPAGSSIAEIVAAAGEHCGVSRLAKSAHVTIDGHVIRREHWQRVRVKAGRRVTVRALPGKGAGNIFRSILLLALAAVAPAIAGPLAAGLGLGALGTSLATAAIGGAIMIGGSLLLSALFPPSQMKAVDDTTPSYSISARKNAAAKWGPIPVMLGNARVNPKYAALPYTEFVGDDQYLRMLFVWGYGPMKLSDIRIGQTSIAEYDDVEIETFEGYPDDGKQTLYPSEVVQDDLNIAVTAAGGPVTRSSAEDAQEIVVDLVAAQGIVNIDTRSGDRGSYSVSIAIAMRPTGSTGAWTDKGTVTLTGSSNQPIRQSFRYVMGGGQWDVRLTRLTQDDAEDHNGGKYSEITWSALKTFRTAPPIAFSKPLAITALRIRATKQLNGTIDTLNGIASTVAKAWNGAEWVDGQETRNPGDLMRLVLQGPANARAQADSRLDLPTIEAFAAHCSAKGFTFDMYRDFTASVRDTLKDIAAAGRGVPLFRDGRWSVAWEEADAPIVQHFTPRNSRNFTWTQTYRTFPQGLRCKFVNREKDYVEDEMLVFDAGWDKTTAKLYEQVEFPGVTDPKLIAEHAAYRIADAKARPAVYKLTVDFEHLIAQRGDRVVAAYDVIEKGLASGRIKAVNGTQLTLDEPAPMEAGKSYGLRVRRRDGASVVLAITTDPGLQSVVTFSGNAPAVGDLYTFGISGEETGVYRILAIKPGEELSAEIDLVDDGNDVQAGDGNTDVPPGSTSQPNPLSIYTPTNLRADSMVIERQTGSVYVTRIFWEAILGPTYASFEAIATNSVGQSLRQTVERDAQFAEFDELAAGEWTFQVRAILADGRPTPLSLPLLVPINVPVTQIGVGLPNLKQAVKDLQNFVGQSVQDLIDQMMAMATATINQDAGQWRDRQTLNRSIKSTYKNATAYVDEQILAATGPDSAIAAEITRLNSEIDDAVATATVAYQTEITDLSGIVTATSDAITKVQVSVDDVSASGLISISANTNPPTGVLSQIDFAARAEKGGQVATAAESLQVYDDNGTLRTRKLVIADQFVFADPDDHGNVVDIVIFQNGAAYLQKLLVDAANIVNLTVDWADITNVHLTSADIGTATIETINVAADQITGDTSFSAPQTLLQPNAGWVEMARVVFDNPNPKPVLTYFSCYVWDATSTGSIIQCRLRRVEDNYTIRQYQTQSDSPQHFFEFFLDGNKRQGTNTYVIEGQTLGGSGYAYGNAVLQWNKR